MPLPAKPDVVTKWANTLLNNGPLAGPNRIDPSVDRQDAGWAWKDKPDFETLNGWMYNVYKLLDWVASGVESLDDDVSGLGSSFGIDENNMSTVAFPSGGTFSAVANVNGAIKIALPQSWTDTRVKFLVDIYEAESGSTTTLLISGTTLSATTEWDDTQASIIVGSRDLRVRFGHDGTKACVVIGETTDTFYFPHVRVRDFTGHGGATWPFANWVSGWVVSVIASVAGITFTGTDNNLVNSAAKSPAYISDVKAFNTGGGGPAVPGLFQRDLNTLVDPDGIVTSLAANQFVLPAGTYDFDIDTTQYASNEGFSLLYDVTNAAVVGQSISVFPNFGSVRQSEYGFKCSYTLAAPATFELRSYVTYAATSDEFGFKHSVSGYNNIYSQIKVTRTK